MSLDTSGGMTSDAVRLVKAIGEEGERWSAGTWTSSAIEQQLLGTIVAAVQRGNALDTFNGYTRATAAPTPCPRRRRRMERTRCPRPKSLSTVVSMCTRTSNTHPHRLASLTPPRQQPRPSWSTHTKPLKYGRVPTNQQHPLPLLAGAGPQPAPSCYTTFTHSYIHTCYYYTHYTHNTHTHTTHTHTHIHIVTHSYHHTVTLTTSMQHTRAER